MVIYFQPHRFQPFFKILLFKAFADARLVVRWFNQQQIDGGGYGSTQVRVSLPLSLAAFYVYECLHAFSVSSSGR